MKFDDTVEQFWVINISKRNVGLADLALTVPKGRRMNLLDAKHFHFTLEQLEASATSGSLFAKNKMLKVSRRAPQVAVKPGLYTMNELRPQQLRSQVVIVDKQYEELMVSDEKFAEDFADPTADPDDIK